MEYKSKYFIVLQKLYVVSFRKLIVHAFALAAPNPIRLLTIKVVVILGIEREH